MLIGAVFFVDFYTKEGSASWARVLKDALGDIGLSLTAPSLRVFFSPRLVFQGISWPSSLSIRPQVILGISIGLLTFENTQAAFRVVYYKLLHGEWGSPIPSLSKRVKERAALVTERCILSGAVLYERFLIGFEVDGTTTTDSDLKAWAKNNPDAAKSGLAGLMSLTGDGIAEVIKMLPNVKTPSFGCARRTRSSRAPMQDVVLDLRVLLEQEQNARYVHELGGSHPQRFRYQR